MQYKEIQKRAWEGNMRLADSGLVFLTFGNASSADRGKGLMAIKPSGLDYSKLNQEDIIVLEIESGKILAGELNPSSDTPSHLHLYRHFPDIGGIVHTHSHYATVWAQAGEAIPCFGTSHADYFYGMVPVSRTLHQHEVEGEYEIDTGAVIIETFREGGLDENAIQGILINQHGPFTWGEDVLAAVKHAVVLEEIARLALDMRNISRDSVAIPSYLLDRHYLRKHGKNAYYGQLKEDGGRTN